MAVRSLHHVRLRTARLEQNVTFAEDFGLHVVSRTPDTVILKTSGGDSYSVILERAPSALLGSVAFEVDSLQDLRKAAQLPGATAIYDLDRPGGGQAVALTDPEGIRIELVAGVAFDDSADPSAPELSMNSPGRISRAGKSQEKRRLAPATLFRIGHIGLYVRDFPRMLAWYTQVLGLLPSDVLHNGDPKNGQILGFLRADQGSRPVDHHCVVLATYKRTDIHHLSFLTQDFETQFRAHRYLTSRGYELSWGVGRHPLGCHVFDTWFSPDRLRWETFSDTDLLTADQPSGLHDIHTVETDEWSDRPINQYFGDI